MYASAWSLFQARSALQGGIDERSQQTAIYGKRVFSRPVFGGNLKRLSESYQGVISPDDLLRSHTPFGTFAKLLPADVETTVLAEVVETGVFSHRRVFPAERHGPLSTAALKWCQHCIDDDRQTFGFAFWRVHHHLPGLNHCWAHERPLVQSCIGVGCRAAQKARSALLPGDRCSCSQPQELHTEQSLGYRAYSALLRRLTVEPSLRLPPERLVAPNQLRKASRDRRTALLLYSWDCIDVADLSQRLQCFISERQLTRLTLGQDFGCHPALIVAWCAIHAAHDLPGPDSAIYNAPLLRP